MEDLNLAELSNPVALVNTAALVHLTELESSILDDNNLVNTDDESGPGSLYD